MSEKYLIVGLGNPGREYAQTRHNVGFWVIEELARRHSLPAFTSERKALKTDGLIQGRRVILAKPQTYMNLSGEAIRSLVDYYKIDIDQLIVIHDDLDLSLGILRIRKGGGHGGQNGVRNIIHHLGTREFARARFGIGRPPGRMQAKDFVLQKFVADDEILAQQVMETTANAIELWLAEGLEKAMSAFNGDINSPNTSPEPDPEEQIRLAERAHELNPNDIKPLELLSRLYKRLQRLDEAARAHLLLAEIHHASGKMNRVVYEWERATRVCPELIEVREEIARTYENDQNNKKAVQTWLALAEYQEKQGQLEAALAALQEALRINPQHPKALELQAAFEERFTQ